ncbi:MAG TPA: bifunctional folylpolyglutamate synthase/dihydrofolate synthase [Candidatus Hydrogenedentes bacterium]|nr:bifunctional folylpolyglutamate synthase/dihydrofolate synthase [Candidatus Hydrogenedentota bacterium]
MATNDMAQNHELKNYLDSLIIHGVKLGLHNIRQLAATVGHPERGYPIVHVAGTNGKGSVLTFLNAIMRKAGYHTGRFVSPHLIEVNERFLLDDLPVDDETFYAHLAMMKRAAHEASVTPTYFEMNAAIAFSLFTQRAVDVALVEVGMGGRFDATNIIEPTVCAITTIDYDHTQYLGETLEQIAFEKAGILKKGAPAVVGDVPLAPLRVIEAQAQRRGAELYRFGEEYHVAPGGDVLYPRISYRGLGMEIDDAPLGLSGMHQVNNAAVAITLAGLLRETFPRITQSVIHEALGDVRWPGRLERVLEQPPVIMDVAHNPAGCRAVAAAVNQCVTVFSVSSDKDVAHMVDALAPVSAPLILTQYAGGRCLPLEQLRAIAANYPHKAFPHLSQAVEKGMQLATPEKPLLITGSIYAVGEARKLLVDHHGARPVVF